MAMLATFSTWLFYNSSISPITGRRRLDMFSPELREKSSKILFSMLSFLMEKNQEVFDKDKIPYKAKLTELMMESMLEKTMVTESDNQYKRVVNIASILIQNNEEIKLNPPKFHITQRKSLQAFSLGRHVILSKGTLDMWTDTQLAFIIAHEISHNVLDHHVENLSLLLVELVVSIMVVFHCIRRRVLLLALFWLVVRPFKLLVSYPVRRMGEVEADDLGMEMMCRACFDIREVIMFWQVLEYINPMGRRILHLISDHPSHIDRLERMLQRMDEMLALRKNAGCEDLEKFLELEMNILSWDDE